MRQIRQETPRCFLVERWTGVKRSHLKVCDTQNLETASLRTHAMSPDDSVFVNTLYINTWAPVDRAVLDQMHMSERTSPHRWCSAGTAGGYFSGSTAGQSERPVITAYKHPFFKTNKLIPGILPHYSETLHTARTRMCVCVFFKLIFQEYLVSFKTPKYLLRVLCNVTMGNFLRQGLST